MGDSRMSNLFNIQMEYLRIMEMIEESEGELTEDIQQNLDALFADRENLLNNLCRHIVNNSNDIRSIDDEMDRLKERKEAYNKKIERTQKAIIDILKHFNMRSPNKKSNGYAFKSPFYSCYTKSVDVVKVDEMLAETMFSAITGKKSKFVNYMIDKKFTSSQLEVINDLGIVPVTDYKISIDKRALAEYVKEVRKQSTLPETETNTSVELDPIAEISSIVVKESLVIK